MPMISTKNCTITAFPKKKEFDKSSKIQYKLNSMEYLSLVPAAALGYATFRATSHPTAKIRRKLPNIKIKRVQVFPVIRIQIFGRVIHLHHWFSLSVLLALSNFIPIGILEPTFTKGVLLGGIIQGLRLPREHRKIIYRDFSLERLTSIKHN